MAVTVSPPPYKTPVIDNTGMLSPRWSAWIRELFERIGGISAPSNSELDEVLDLSDVESDIDALEADVALLETSDTSQNTAIALLRSDLSQGPVL
jgi:hypothetical protein